MIPITRQINKSVRVRRQGMIKLLTPRLTERIALPSEPARPLVNAISVNAPEKWKAAGRSTEMTLMVSSDEFSST